MFAIYLVGLKFLPKLLISIRTNLGQKSIPTSIMGHFYIKKIKIKKNQLKELYDIDFFFL